MGGILVSYPPGGGGGGAPAFDPSTTVNFYDEFITTQTVSGGNSAVISAEPWVASGNGSVARDFTMPGAFGAITVNSVAAGQMGLYTTDSTTSSMEFGSVLFDCKIRFQFDSVNDAIIYTLGFQDVGYSPQYYSNAILLSYDQSASPNMRFITAKAGSYTVVDSGIAADTNVHTLRMRCINIGTILFSLDGGVEIPITTNLPVVSMFFGVAVGTYNTTTLPHAVSLDYMWFTVTGLSR